LIKKSNNWVVVVVVASPPVYRGGGYNYNNYPREATRQQITILQTNIQGVIVGSLLGDGCLVDPKVGTVYFRFKQSIIHLAYFFATLR